MKTGKKKKMVKEKRKSRERAGSLDVKSKGNIDLKSRYSKNNISNATDCTTKASPHKFYRLDELNEAYRNPSMYAYLFFALLLAVGVISFPHLLTGNFEGAAITGLAISGLEDYKEITTSSLEKSTSAINPVLGNIVEGKEFSVEALAYPFMEGVTTPEFFKMNNFMVQIYYDPNYLTYKDATPLIKNFNINVDSSTGMLVIKGTGISPFDNFFVMEPAKFMELKFIPTKKTESTKITFSSFSAVNSFDNGKMAKVVSSYKNAEITVLEKGMDTFIEEYSSSHGTEKYWKLMDYSGQNAILNEWKKLTPEQKQKYQQCLASCVGKECGTDGCGGVCGAYNGKCAGENYLCLQNKCACQPNCAGKICGDDGCGGLCSSKECTKEMTNALTPKKFDIFADWMLYVIIIILVVLIITTVTVVERKKLRDILGRWKAKRANAAAKSAQSQQTSLSKPAQQIAPQKSQAAERSASQTLSQTSKSALPKSQVSFQVPPQLKDFVKRQQSKGVDNESIRKALLNVGWKKEMVEEALK